MSLCLVGESGIQKIANSHTIYSNLEASDHHGQGLYVFMIKHVQDYVSPTVEIQKII